MTSISHQLLPLSDHSFFAFPLIFVLLIFINVMDFRQKHYLYSYLRKMSLLPCETQLRETLIRLELLFCKMSIVTLAEHCI